MDGVRGYFLGPSHVTTPAAVMTNPNKKFRVFKSKETIHKNKGGPDCRVSNDKFSSLQLRKFVLWSRSEDRHISKMAEIKIV